jgi:ubiquinone/menaquinone biosynthesis C-methylase UbiE
MTMSFDRQAEQFDARAGLPDDACLAIADAIITMTGDPPDGRLVEVGAGTGQIGQHLLRAMPRYVGFDLSGAMLKVFRERLVPDERDAQLIEADGNQRWPVADGSVDVVFSSRTLHLLDRGHVVREVLRVMATGGARLITGRVRREPDSVKAEMRRQMRRLLREEGIEGRDSQQNRQALFDDCLARGARLLEPRVASSWQIEHAPLASIESWQAKEGLAGMSVSESVKQSVLTRLRQWAVQRYGDLQQPLMMHEDYALEGVEIRPR